MVDTVRDRGRVLACALMASIAPIALVGVVPAHAQDVLSEVVAEDDQEIVITGTRRGDASVTDTALAITAFTGETLERYNVDSLSDLRLLDPSIGIQSFGAAQTKIVFRGIDSDVGATSALYLNESAVLGGTGGNILGDGKPGIRLHDVDHVEVLKGPQGTLFGTSSMSGTLRVLTRAPKMNEWEGSGEIALAHVEDGNPFGEANATVNVPLVRDTLALRVTGWTEIGGGYIDQVAQGNRFSNNNDQFVRGTRGELMWQVTPDFSLRGIALHQAVDVDGSQQFQRGNARYLNTSPTIEEYSDRYSLFSLIGDYDLGFGALVASVNYSKQNVLNSKDSTPTNQLFGVNAPLSFVARIDFDDLNAELRFSSNFDGPVQLVTGVFYENTDSVYQTNAIQAPNIKPVCHSFEECRALPDGGRSIYEFGTNTDRKIEQYAAYAQLDYSPVDALTLTAGFRYFRADIRDVVTNLQTVFPDFVFGQVTVPSVTGDNSGRNEEPSYNFAALWKVTEDVSLYARAASGFRIGGVNTATSLAQQAGVTFPGTYDPDSLWSYEAGVKGYLVDQAIFFDVSAYRIDWTDQQLLAEAAGAFAYTINAGKTVAQGIEFNTTLRPVYGLSVSGSVNYVDSKLDKDLPADVVNAGTVGFKGDRVPLSPRWSGSATIDYEVAAGDTRTAFVQGAVTYRGASYTTFNRANAFDSRLPDYTLFSAQLGVRTEDGFEASLFGENLSNAVPTLGLVTSLDGVRVFTTRPRTIGLRLRKRF